MKTHFVVTGAGGFLGSALMRWFEGQGVSVLGLARNCASGSGLQKVDDYADIDPPEDGVLIHLAQGRDVAAAEDSTARKGMLDLCKRLLAKDWRHVVFASSAVVYGDGEAHLRCPDEVPAVSGPYAQTKLQCEQDVLAHGGSVLRISNVYGPGMAANNVMSDILKQVPGNGDLVVRDDTPVRDFVWIEDAAACLGKAAMAAREGVFNVGTGRGISIHNLAQCALDIAGQSDRKIISTKPSTHPSTLILDIGKTMEAFDWTPSVNVRDGMQKILKVA